LLLTNIGFTLFQTAMMNSVSQTLAPLEAGTGMGLFNLVSIISEAAGTALVGKLLDGGWLEVAILPSVGLAKGFAYSKILFVFALTVVLGGVVYLRSYGQRAPERSAIIDPAAAKPEAFD
jgi:MFS transporter, DHA2 family, metal-tetracycline-proton antiporter